jgi:hypothetical protein
MIYFDTSFLAPLFRSEATSSRIARFFQEQSRRGICDQPLDPAGILECDRARRTNEGAGA